MFLLFQEFEDSINKRKITASVFLKEKGREKKAKEGRAMRPKRGGPTWPGTVAAWDPLK